MVTRPASPKRAEVLAREEREAADRAQAADRVAVIAGADRLRRVLDDRDAARLRRLDDRRHVGRLAEQVHRHDRLGPRRDGRDRRVDVDVERVGIDVDQHRRRADAHDAAGGGEERIGRRDDLVAGADVERHQRREQRVGARRQADRVRHAEVRAQLALEAFDFRAADEALAVADARDGVEQRLAKRRVLRLEVEQRDGHKRPMVLVEGRGRNLRV